MKRIFDLALVLLTAPLWTPMLLALAGLLRLRLGSPVLFRQARAGLGGKLFLIIKFRTMTDAKDASGKLLSDAERLTSVGKWLRSTSLDELPELINVLKGEMSLVGPRPLLAQYLERYTPRQARRHEVRPGITGLVQVRGRNSLSWEEKFEWDIKYVDTHNLWLDVKILALTAKAVVRRTGISATGDVTMPEFLPLARRPEDRHNQLSQQSNCPPGDSFL